MNISVIIPVWNRRQLVQRAVESVLAQTYSAYELILVDDGSDDGTWEYIELLHCDILTIVKKRISHCGKPGTVRNRGIEIAQGDWIAFLDSDDYWFPFKLKAQMEAISNKENISDSMISICHTKELWVRNGVIVSQKKQKHVRSGNLFQDSLKKCIMGPSTVLMHRSIIEQYGMFNETLEIAEDYEYWLRICAHETVCYVEETSVVKCSDGQIQLSTKYEYIEKFRIQALNILLASNTLSDDQQEFAQEELVRKKMIWTQGQHKRKKKDEEPL